MIESPVLLEFFSEKDNNNSSSNQINHKNREKLQDKKISSNSTVLAGFSIY